MRLLRIVRVYFKRQFDPQWLWGHPDEWSDDEWFDWERKRK